MEGNNLEQVLAARNHHDPQTFFSLRAIRRVLVVANLLFLALGVLLIVIVFSLLTTAQDVRARMFGGKEIDGPLETTAAAAAAGATPSDGSEEEVSSASEVAMFLLVMGVMIIVCGIYGHRAVRPAQLLVPQRCGGCAGGLHILVMTFLILAQIAVLLLYLFAITLFNGDERRDLERMKSATKRSQAIAITIYVVSFVLQILIVVLSIYYRHVFYRIAVALVSRSRSANSPHPATEQGGGTRERLPSVHYMRKVASSLFVRVNSAQLEEVVVKPTGVDQSKQGDEVSTNDVELVERGEARRIHIESPSSSSQPPLSTTSASSSNTILVPSPPQNMAVSPSIAFQRAHSEPLPSSSSSPPTASTAPHNNDLPSLQHHVSLSLPDHECSTPTTPRHHRRMHPTFAVIDEDSDNIGSGEGGGGGGLRGPSSSSLDREEGGAGIGEEETPSKLSRSGSSSLFSALKRQFSAPKTPKTPSTPQDCAICCSNVSNAVILECGHGGMCVDCALQIWKMTKKCPLCRAPILLVMRVADDCEEGGVVKVEPVNMP